MSGEVQQELFVLNTAIGILSVKRPYEMYVRELKQEKSRWFGTSMLTWA